MNTVWTVREKYVAPAHQLLATDSPNKEADTYLRDLT